MATILSHLILPSDRFPNSAILPVVIHRQAFASSPDLADEMERRFHANGWGNSWRNGLYRFHHYHSQAHEALGVYSGWVEVQLGGETGPVLRLEAGDALILPAGMAHRQNAASADFKILGAYPPGQFPDMNMGTPAELAAAFPTIAALPRPATDPVTGKAGGLMERWSCPSPPENRIELLETEEDLD